MRYFIAKNGSTVVEKKALSGDNTQIDALVAQFKSDYPALVVTELDQATFDGTVCVAAQTSAQVSWAAFKTQVPTPTALQGIIYLAKYLGLE